MNLRALTDPGLIQIQAPFTTRDEAIAALAGLLAAQGKLHDHTAFVNEVMQREALGPTALGEGLAVPHGKCAAVREAAFAVATLRETVAWQGVEGDEPVRLIFLLAIPAAQAGTTHIQLLTELTTLLAPGLFKTFEKDLGKSTWLLGLAGITEGAIPMAIEDPLRVIGAFVTGSMVTGAIVGSLHLGLATPGAGIFSLFLLSDGGLGRFIAAAGWFGAALIGSAISTLVLILWRRHAVKAGRYLPDGTLP
ncbi:fructose PTS transporter subunit IIA [Cronobacter sakazakii]|uniref:fructose PTS transporter subunit IIA n=1 Tax=Cronobacter sakazakii TaxID=28141 RepID=UPI000D0194FC|nr:fructose PTS transporter subunit IIA [Cronobacter sakazakii]ELY2808263.1 PTS sugar transporter subunit IIA [Cronobacter sakazakii]ELY5886402.1 PTS sugar transporter subunit IIA [Cronobacter sakazakii]ELY6219811.1 PTS sugar transporter subunit IIA [Cronobacter sakazakii]QWR95246.1 PTS transporter subunit EIIA [Cronobacter sakazakii]